MKKKNRIGVSLRVQSSPSRRRLLRRPVRPPKLPRVSLVQLFPKQVPQPPHRLPGRPRVRPDLLADRSIDLRKRLVRVVDADLEFDRVVVHLRLGFLVERVRVSEEFGVQVGVPVDGDGVVGDDVPIRLGGGEPEPRDPRTPLETPLEDVDEGARLKTFRAARESL